VQHVVAVIVPLRVEAAAQQPGGVAVVLQHQVHVAPRYRASCARARPRAISVSQSCSADRVRGVHAQAVEAVFLQPVARIAGEKICALRDLREVDGAAPGGGLAVLEEAGRVVVQVVAVGAEVVVDHVEQHHQAQAVGGVDEALEMDGVP
jgi:hypothetical protein